MATSGSYNFSMTAAEVIQAAYEDLGVTAPGVSVSTAQSNMALKRLNMLVKQLQGDVDMARGLKVWTRQRITLFLAKGQQTYLIGPGSSDARATTQAGYTTLSAAEAAGRVRLLYVRATTGAAANAAAGTAAAAQVPPAPPAALPAAPPASSSISTCAFLLPAT